MQLALSAGTWPNWVTPYEWCRFLGCFQRWLLLPCVQLLRSRSSALTCCANSTNRTVFHRPLPVWSFSMTTCFGASWPIDKCVGQDRQTSFGGGGPSVSTASSQFSHGRIMSHDVSESSLRSKQRCRRGVKKTGGNPKFAKQLEYTDRASRQKTNSARSWRSIRLTTCNHQRCQETKHRWQEM